MTSATLFREGYDLDEVIAELESEHPGQVRVVDVAYGRDGGVLGFFAKRTVGVRYRIEDVEDTLPGSPNSSGALPDPLEEMLRAAEAAEMIESGRAPQRPEAAPEGGEANVEFARMLLELAADKAAARRAAEEAAAAPISPVIPPAYQPTYQPTHLPPAAPSSDLDALLRNARTRPIGAHRADAPEGAQPPAAAPTAPVPPTAVPAAPTPPVSAAAPRHHATHSAPSLDNHYALRRKLAELGVPFAWIPEHVDDPYRAVEQVIARLPEPRPIRLEPGQVLVVAGPVAEAEYTAARLCASLRLDAAGTVHTVTQRWQAERLAARIRHERSAPAIVVVATDDLVEDEPVDDGWAADIVAALTPDLVWLAVDAATKPADLRAAAAGLGRISAIAVSGTRRTTSPASVWELNTPVALLDGRRATRGAWTALLLDKLSDLGDLEL